MSLPKILMSFTFVLFGVIFVAAFLKKGKQEEQENSLELVFEPVEVEIPDLNNFTEEDATQEKATEFEIVEMKGSQDRGAESLSETPEANRIEEFFNKKEPRFPIVQTITYKSHIPWLKGRSAWISDYSSHYRTSRHFIARSLNGGPQYEKQDVKNGDRFNVLNEEKNFEFYLLIDLLASKMWFYYYDKDTNERVLVKTYQVGLGRPEPKLTSGFLTPTGKYTLGDKIAIYKPNTLGFHQGEKIEMVRIFGTRWIPFGEEISDCTEPAKGLGIHGLPLQPNSKGELTENTDSLGKYESDGCIRMATKDIEELFSIIISRPTTVELIKGFHNAKLPGVANN